MSKTIHGLVTLPTTRTPLYSTELHIAASFVCCDWLTYLSFLGYIVSLQALSCTDTQSSDAVSDYAPRLVIPERHVLSCIQNGGVLLNVWQPITGCQVVRILQPSGNTNGRNLGFGDGAMITNSKHSCSVPISCLIRFRYDMAYRRFLPCIEFPIRVSYRADTRKLLDMQYACSAKHVYMGQTHHYNKV